MSLSPQFEDAFRAARHEAERDWPGPTLTPPTRAEADEDAAQPMTVQPRDCGGCGICFRCVLARRWGG